MIVFEKARELGELIRTTKEAVDKDDAMEAYMNDKEALAKMKEYEDFQREVQMKMERQDYSKDELEDATSKLREMGTELKNHPVAGRYIDSVNKFNRMVNQAFDIAHKTALGDTGGCSCGGDCDCGGNEDCGGPDSCDKSDCCGH